MATNLQLAKLSDLVYEPDGGTNGQIKTAIGAEWVRYANLTDLGIAVTNGYYATAYRNTLTGEIVIAHRGVELTSGSDIVAVLKTAQGKISNNNGQFASAQEFYTALKRRVSGDSTVAIPPTYAQTGHSLGGALASLMGAFTGEPTVAFDAIGVKEVMQQVGLDPNASYPNIRSVSAYFDPAKLVGTRIGQVSNILVSSYWLVPDAVEPIFAGILSAKLVNLAPVLQYLYSQHRLTNLVDALMSLPDGAATISERTNSCLTRFSFYLLKDGRSGAGEDDVSLALLILRWRQVA